MFSWRDSFLFFSASAEARPLLLAAEPAWIWSRDGGQVLWANPAGGARLGAAEFGFLASRRWTAEHPLRRELEALVRFLPDSGSLARLRLASDIHSVPVACRCRRIRAGDHRGVLVRALEFSGEASSPELLAAFISDRDTAVTIADAAGAVVARAGPDHAAPYGDAVELVDSGRVLRLTLGARADEHTEAAAGRPSKPTALDDARPAIGAAPPEEAPAPGRAMDNAALPIKPAIVDDPPAANFDPAEPGLSGSGSPGHETRTGAAATTAQENEAVGRSVMAGRVARELSRQPVRFLWQTDGADRFLFVSPGLAEVVGRNAEIVGERWEDIAARLRLDPGSHVGRVLAQRDTWSGQTAWWPVEGSNVRVPAELTGLPVFAGDRSFQGYRGFGVLKPAEALMPATFEARFGAAEAGRSKPADQVPPYEETAAALPGTATPVLTPAANVVPIRADLERVADQTRLTAQEFNAFEEIAAALRKRINAPDVLEDPQPGQIDAEDVGLAATELQPSAEPEPAPSVVPLFSAPSEERPEEHGPDAAESEPAVEASVPAARAEAPAAPAPAEAPPISSPHRAELAPPSRPALPEGEAQRRMRELTAILDTATDGVVIMDADGLIESANSSAEALFGLESRELQNMQFGALLTPESAQSALDYLSGLKDNGVASILNEGREIEARAGAGSIPLFMTIGRISNGDKGRFCAVLRDITHWKRTEAELVAARRAAEEASSQKSEFLARVSHEIRTPLNAIIGFAEVMIEERFGPVENERYRDYLRDIRTSGEHVVSLVNDLLDISKIEAGKLDLEFVAVPLNDLVRESIAMMQPQAGSGRVVLRSSLSRDVPGIVADQRTMRQIVINILSNAIKFTGPGGQVIASTSLAESGEAILRIRDTGEGMSEDELARALEPFRQIATSTLSDRTGTGLGLPLTRALVDANRASLAIRSARGEGTVVTITFAPTRVLSE